MIDKATLKATNEVQTCKNVENSLIICLFLWNPKSPFCTTMSPPETPWSISYEDHQARCSSWLLHCLTLSKIQCQVRDLHSLPFKGTVSTGLVCRNQLTVELHPRPELLPKLIASIAIPSKSLQTLFHELHGVEICPSLGNWVGSMQFITSCDLPKCLSSQQTIFFLLMKVDTP